MRGVRDAIDRAVEAVREVPDDLRQVAFGVVLWHELVGLGEVSCSAVASGSSVSGRIAQDTAVSAMAPVDPASVDRKNRNHQAAWAVLDLTHRGENATVAAVRRFIKDEEGQTPEERANLSKRLRGFVPLYMSRTEEEGGKGFVYRPNSRTLEIFGQDE
jgi:hypothetical protein